MEKQAELVKEQIDLVELVKGISSDRIFQLFLVLRGDKSVTDSYINDIKEVEDLKERLSSADLSAVEEKWGEGYVVYISKNIKLAEEALKINSDIRDGKDEVNKYELNKRYGELMGYPETAINSYVSGGVMPDNKQKEIFMNLGFENKFFPFMLSNDSFGQELKQIADWYYTIIHDAPQLIDVVFPDPEEARKFILSVNKFIAVTKNY